MAIIPSFLTILFHHLSYIPRFQDTKRDIDISIFDLVVCHRFGDSLICDWGPYPVKKNSSWLVFSNIPRSYRGGHPEVWQARYLTTKSLATKAVNRNLTPRLPPGNPGSGPSAWGWKRFLRNSITPGRRCDRQTEFGRLKIWYIVY